MSSVRLYLDRLMSLQVRQKKKCVKFGNTGRKAVENRHAGVGQVFLFGREDGRAFFRDDRLGVHVSVQSWVDGHRATRILWRCILYLIYKVSLSSLASGVYPASQRNQTGPIRRAARLGVPAVPRIRMLTNRYRDIIARDWNPSAAARSRVWRTEYSCRPISCRNIQLAWCEAADPLFP